MNGQFLHSLALLIFPEEVLMSMSCPASGCPGGMTGRSGYQWTRKGARNTITVSLSQPQFLAMNAAVQNERTLWKTIQPMEKISRQILFASLPVTRRRQRLGKKAIDLVQGLFGSDPSKPLDGVHSLRTAWAAVGLIRGGCKPPAGFTL